MDTLFYDIFLSELILDGVISPRVMKGMLEQGWINSVREICSSGEWVSKAAETGKMAEFKILRAAIKDSKRKEKAKRLAEAGQNSGMFSISLGDDDYPDRFKKLTGMPITLYGLGDRELISGEGRTSVAVVGTREPSSYGVRVTIQIVQELCRHPLCIVSGLARGIDTKAHQTALDTGGKTVAVLANGLDRVYPTENTKLFEEIKQTGCVLSELPPGRAPVRQFFPARNRILSALSDAVAIIEAGEKSGTLHTAAFAAAQGREVFAVPGNIYSSKSKGSLKLIQDGAQPLLTAENILFYLADIRFIREMDQIRNMTESSGNLSPDLSEELQKVWIMDTLEAEHMSVESLVEVMGVSFSKLALLLTELELSGKIVEQDGKYMVIGG